MGLSASHMGIISPGGDIMKVSDIMSGRVVTIDKREPVIAAARLLKRMNLGALPVTDGGKLAGMLTDRDIVLRCVASGGDAREMTVEDIMTRGVVTASPDAKVGEAAPSSCPSTTRSSRLPATWASALAIEYDAHRGAHAPRYFLPRCILA